MNNATRNGGADPDLHRKLVEESTDIATIIDDNGTITYVSPSVERILGYEPDELVGEVGYDYVHPEDRETNAEGVERALEEGTASVEVRFRDADGNWRWIESMLRDRRDEPVIDGILATSRDISERKKEERAYRDLAEEYGTLLDNVEDAIFLLDVSWTGNAPVFEFERLSPSYERQTGIETEDVRGETPTDVFGRERGAELVANYHRCARARKPISYEEELEVSEDARFWETSLAPVMSDGEVSRIIGITRNVTERVRWERKLRNQNDRLEEFASVVSHDLRNPLNVAQGRINLLREEVDSEHLLPIERSLDRMADIIRDTLTLARQGRVVSEMDDVVLEDIVESCWGTVATGSATVEIVDHPTIRGDRNRLRHLFENLFRNAVEHAGADVTVRVGLIDDHGIYVEDDGEGIPEASREAVLEPGHTSLSGGTGFGLTIVNRIADAHGWELSITEGTDGGSRFEFHDVEIVER